MEGLSSRGRYAVRVLLYLVMRGSDNPVRISDIAAAEEIPQQYLEQLMIRMKVAGFVRSVRGARGGYVAVCDPAVVTVADVLSAVEGPVQLAPCLKEACGRATTCVTRAVWQSATDAMNAVFMGTTLKMMVESARTLEGPGAGGNYSI